MQDVKRCPKCDSAAVLRVVYGLPSQEMVEASVAGRIALGYCVHFPDYPDYTCQSCGHEWRL
jgi:hypothetical protein